MMSSSSSSFKSRYNSSFDKQRSSDPSSSIALVNSKSKNANHLCDMVKKFMETKKKTTSSSSKPKAEFIAPDFNTSIIRSTSTRGGFGGLHKKLFATKSSSKTTNDMSRDPKHSMEVKPRTLAMVLRSERELLSQNKDLEIQITKLNLMLQDKNTEVDKLKDLCLKQREEIMALKSAILFPDVMNTQLQGLLEKQDSELKHAKQIIPTLQRQVTSLTGQLQCLAEDLAEVKADKYAVGGCYDGFVSSPRTPTTYDQEEATNSLELSSGDRTTAPGSPDDLFLNDLNPCLTPYAKSKSKEFEAIEYRSSSYNNDNNNTTKCHEIGFGSYGRKLSKSSSDQQYVKSTDSSKNIGCRSDENKYTYGKHMRY